MVTNDNLKYSQLRKVFQNRVWNWQILVRINEQNKYDFLALRRPGFRFGRRQKNKNNHYIRNSFNELLIISMVFKICKAMSFPWPNMQCHIRLWVAKRIKNSWLGKITGGGGEDYGFYRDLLVTFSPVRFTSFFCYFSRVGSSNLRWEKRRRNFIAQILLCHNIVNITHQLQLL